ncbi:hypothetical protein [Streptomyces erythrochromogenes]|uniref:hypothetical protein n=1 Tax=Streptomyces erythrochromogenes TaxID=285574 RepID=UPI00386FBD01|nr:hypothetical protein OG364_11405 [Streptomyces erythrochromogenes]
MGTATNSVGPEVWPKTAIADFPGRAMFTTFGVLNDDASEERAVVSSTHVRDGRIDASDGTAHPDGGRPSRATLREGDLVVVLVRRAGDAALVTAQHAGWTATRSVGIIRAAPHIVRWLQIWLQTPTAKAWIDAEVTAHVEPTLSLDSLRRMPFPLPPTGTITKFHSAISLIEEKIALNRTTAVATLQLADAMHAEWSSDSATWESRPLGEVTMAKSGKGSAKSLVLRSGTPGIDGITPTDLFELSVPYVERSRLCTPGDTPGVCPPGTLLLATRPAGAHIALTRRTVAPTRGVLAVRPRDILDGWWLLHELRSRNSTIVGAAQGQNAREISAAAFSRLHVTWPDASIRARFHELLDPLHAMAMKLTSEITTLSELKDAVLRDISARAEAVSG